MNTLPSPSVLWTVRSPPSPIAFQRDTAALLGESAGVVEQVDEDLLQHPTIGAHGVQSSQTRRVADDKIEIWGCHEILCVRDAGR